MAQKNKFSRKFKSKLTRSDWEAICPPLEYRLIDGPEALAKGIVPTGLTDVNLVAIGASGSCDNTMMYFANYFRVDGTEIDQEPYFELYEKGATQPGMYGIFHHADFLGRTETLREDEIARIAASGSSVDISFTGKPDMAQGTLDELRAQGKITGFDYTWSKGMNAMGANASNSGSTQSGGTEDKK